MLGAPGFTLLFRLLLQKNFLIMEKRETMKRKDGDKVAKSLFGKACEFPQIIGERGRGQYIPVNDINDLSWPF